MCGKRFDLLDKRLLCEVCYNTIRLNTPPFCKKCGRPQPYEDGVCEDCRIERYHFDAAYSACIYDGVVRECFHKFKYRGCFALERLFRDLILEFTERYVDMWRYNWVVPVPLHRIKYRERTFNQSAVLAAHLSKKFGVPLLEKNLIRVRLGSPQMMLPKDKRLEDIKGSFKVKDPASLEGKSLLLVDDVFTTGATVNECSKVLKKAGAGSVQVLTLARSV